ncbi:MAG TPA: hypothetical protein VLE02_01830 [Nitrosarchaeum sp.]|nr:hypothetical protein [Nitrosarchaeum sp.]
MNLAVKKLDVHPSDLDLIFFSMNGSDDDLVRWWFGIGVSHICVCVMINEVAYVIETDIKYGTRIVPFADKLKSLTSRNSCDIIGIRKYKGVCEVDKCEIDFILKHKSFDRWYILKRLLGKKCDDCCGIVQSFLEEMCHIKFEKNMDLRDFIFDAKNLYEEISYFSFWLE